ncbi:MAG TPA: hypothetical protein VKP30_06665 [Polyangiaceae bacterium]|nr:hypothetical protein [Polyangiaceae bacterium]
MSHQAEPLTCTKRRVHLTQMPNNIAMDNCGEPVPKTADMARATMAIENL